MAKRTVEVLVGGQRHRLVTTLDAATLQRLAHTVDERLAALAPGQKLHPQAWLLVALSLAQDLEAAEERAAASVERHREVVSGLLERVESALAVQDGDARSSSTT